MQILQKKQQQTINFTAIAIFLFGTIENLIKWRVMSKIFNLAL